MVKPRVVRVIVYSELINNEIQSVKVYGSITELIANEDIIINGNIRSEAWLRKVMQTKNIFHNNSYFISRVNIERKTQ